MNIKLSTNLFLEQAELNRFKKFLKEDGHERDFLMKQERFGIIYNAYFDPNFSFFKPTATNVANTINVASGIAFDKLHRVAVSMGKDLLIPQQNKWYWVKVKHKFSSLEEGTVTIGGSSGGQLRGTGTKFTEVLRGQPNFPAKIKFTDSVNYPLEYEILQVNDDVTAYLQGSFPITEQLLKYSVVGTFTPGYYPPDADKFPFQYDDFDYSFELETGTNVMPAFIEGEEFFIARVMSTGSGIQVEDKRRSFISEARAERFYAELPAKTNPLIAIDGIKRTAINGRIFYMVQVSWGFSITSETRQSNSNKVIITNGYGGKYKTTATFVDGDFDGWRYYYQDGDYSRILSSVKNGTNIEIIVDCLKHESVGAMVCPDCEEVEVVLRFGLSASSIFRIKREWFHTFTENVNVTIEDAELDPTYKTVGIKYRLKSVFKLTNERDLNVNTYGITGLDDVTSNAIVLNGAATGGVVLAWRGIDPFCLNSTFGQVIYYKLNEINPVTQPTDYFPNNINPIQSTEQTTRDLQVAFYSDAGLTTPLSVTMNNLKVLVKRKQTIQQTYYDIPTPGSSTTYNQVAEYVDVFTINAAGTTAILQAAAEKTRQDYEHPTGVVGTRRIIFDVTNTFAQFPSNVLILGRNGQRGFTNLEQYDTATGTATGQIKPNASLDPDFIATSIDDTQCPFVVPAMAATYGYSLNVKKVEFTGSTNGVRASTLVANTEAGGFSYQLQAYDDGEQVTLKVRAQALDAANQTGKVWVRVTWRAAGATSDTLTEVQISSDVETTLAQVFMNIKSVNVSNY